MNTGVWIGGIATAALKRAARLGDGWMVEGDLQSSAPLIDRLHAYLREAGRDPASFPIEGPGQFDPANPEACWKEIEAWRRLGASHVRVRLPAAPHDPVAMLRRLRETSPLPA